MLGALACLLGVLIPTAGFARSGDWESVRAEIIDPLNSALHAHLPAQIRDRNLEGLLRFYATDVGTGLSWDRVDPVRPGAEERTLRWSGPSGEEPIRERYRRLLELFERIERAELRIDRVDWRHPEPRGHRAKVRLLVRGFGPDGDLRHLEQHATLWVHFYDPFWEIAAEEVTARTLVSRPTPRFERVAEAAGIRSVHASELSPAFHLMGGEADNPVRQASGVAVADVDGDGCEDLVLAGSPDVTLYRSLCDGRFEDATRVAGLPQPYPAAAGGVVFFDYDNDGDQDLLVTAVTGGARLFQNSGAGRFSDATAAARIPEAPWGAMAAISDYDRDGALDVYIAGMGDHGRAVPKPSYDARNGTPGLLLRNRGDGSFSDVTRRAGVGSRGWDMAAAWGDYDGDDWPDLYVANEFGNNRLYRNERDGTFSDRTAESGTADGGSGMGATWSDFDGDGSLDLFVSGMHPNSGWALFHPAFPTPIPWFFRFIGLFTEGVQLRRDEILEGLTRGSTLFRNQGDGTFADVSDSAGVRDGQWGWGAQFLDYDNDGRLDLYAVNGFISGPILDDV